jgi:hypothetical protein
MYYFAYGSNMCTARLAQRVPGVQPVGPAWLGCHRLYWHLRGGDGSGKCNIVATQNPADRVYGVVFEFDAAHIDGLHAAEGPAYNFLKLEVGRADGAVTAATYRGRWDWLDDSLAPFTWYRDFVLIGARQHRLPRFWIEQLASVSAVADPNAAREARNRAILG